MSKQSPRYVSDKQLSERLEVSRQTIWRWVREGNLPSPIKLGTNCTRWKLSDIENWEAGKVGAA
ncbi:helix-turn-helix transcriptional regulator [Marinobacter alexandrii]|jgi:prophage regulatory protein|uniref:helix-turn-helix transcriptional regulator n=1 Tax=Marinobacter alexandrii TaxID=2570351 RepID=UPI002ABE2471|nr:helix-turn-helix domain-containing protein [Marinobacter alexandrii]